MRYLKGLSLDIIEEAKIEKLSDLVDRVYSALARYYCRAECRSKTIRALLDVKPWDEEVFDNFMLVKILREVDMFRDYMESIRYEQLLKQAEDLKSDDTQ